MKVTLFFIILSILLIVRFQYLNWKKYKHEGNGANLQRISLVIISIATLGISVGCLLRDFTLVIIWLFTIPTALIALYWIAIRQSVIIYYNIIKNKLK